MPIDQTGTYRLPNDAFTVIVTDISGTQYAVNVYPTYADLPESETFGDEGIQDFVDYMSKWDKLNPDQPIYANKSRIYSYAVTPTGEPS